MSDPSYAHLANNVNDKLWKDRGIRRTLVVVGILYTAVYAVGYDGSLLNGFQALPAWNEQFGHPTGYTLGLIAASYYLPKIPTPFIMAPIVDRFGRKMCLVPGAIIMIAGSLLGTFAQNRGMLIGSRVLLGIGTTTSQATAAMLIQELVHPRLRHLCGSFFQCMYHVGAISASWLVFGMTYVHGTSWAWRAASLIQGLGPLILVLTIWIPESPRWLIKQGRTEDAHKILAEYHANGKMDDELVLFEVREIQASVEYERTSQSVTWLDFVRTAANRRRLAIIVLMASAAQFSGNGIVQFYLVPVLRQVGITKADQQAGINGGLAVVNFLSSIAGASLVEKVGRRPLFLVSIGGMLASYAAITGLAGGFASTQQSSVGMALVPFIFFFMMFYSFGITPIPLLYVPEILPMSLRAKGLSLYMTVTGACLAFNNFVNPIAMAAIGWRYYAVYLGMLVFYFCAFFVMLRETRGLTTEEALMVFESDEVKEQHREKLKARDQLDQETRKMSLEHIEEKA